MKRKIAVSIVLLLGASLVGASTLDNFVQTSDTLTVEPPQFWLDTGGDLVLNEQQTDVTETLGSAEDPNQLSYNVEQSDVVFTYDLDAVVTLSKDSGDEETDLGDNVNDVNVELADSQDCTEDSSSEGEFVCIASFTTDQDVSNGEITVEVDTEADVDIDEDTNLDFEVAN